MNKQKIKIEAIVKTSDSLCFVINRPINLLYTKIDRETIIGYDEGVLSFYRKETYSSKLKAFGGRKFKLQLTDGSIEECFGQWWDGMSESAKELYNSNNICYFPSATKDELKECYVYIGYRCEKKWLEKLISEYKGKIYEYWEYEKKIRKR